MTVSLSTVRAQEKDQSGKIDELEKKVEELTTEIEIMKATTGTEQKEEKFKLFGYFGARYQDLSYGTKKTNALGNPVYETTTSSRLPDKTSFLHNNLNIYFQFNPVENFRVLSEIRFLYYPGGISDNTEIDRSSMIPFTSNKFWAINPENGSKTWYEGNGILYFNHPLQGATNLQAGFVALPINKEGKTAIKTAQTTIDIYTGKYIDPTTSQPTTTPTTMPIILKKGAWVPVDSEGNYILTVGDKYIKINPAAYNPALTTYTDASSLVFTDTPLMRSAMLRDNRVENYFLDHSTAFWSQYGSLNIERAFMEWTPSDALGLRFGKFFTPFGIWNVDHGTPVLMSARVPYFLTYLPETQMGLELFGRYNFAHSDLDYSLYVANGRGILKELEDNNDEKSVGGRLALKLQMPLFKELAIGGSGYYGHHDETAVHFGLDYNYEVSQDGVTILNDNGNISSMKTEYKTVTSFDETLLGLDFKAVFQDLSFQSEYMYRKWDITRFDSDYFFKWSSFYYLPTTDPLEEVTAFYAQVAYKLPWEIKGVAITPFFRWETTKGYMRSKGLFTAEDTGYQNDFEDLSLGLNIRQNPYVVYKLDYTMAMFKVRDRLDFNVLTLCADIAF